MQDAQFYSPTGVAMDTAGNLYVADNSNHRVRRTTPAGAVSTIAGATLGCVDGVGSAARFTSPYDLAVDAAGTVYVADTYTYRIRKIN